MKNNNDDYHTIFANKAISYLDIKNKKCLVVGCKRGQDCNHFVKFGVKEVHGLDICDEIGVDFNHRKVKYYKISAEDMQEISNDTYDLVYCFATMEHIPRIDLSFAEMVRVTKTGGIIFCFSSPLWYSEYGHHKKNFFKNYPWIHLRMNESEINEYCKKNNITDKINSTKMKYHIAYMLNPKYFNMLPAKKYIDVCKNLKDINIIENKLGFYKEEELTPEIFAELEPKGYTKEELLASSHTFIAQKANKV